MSLKAESVLVDGSAPDCCPVRQAQGGASWLASLLEESTGRSFPMRGGVVFPGWFVERMGSAWKRAGLPWVQKPKGFSRFIRPETVRVSPDGRDASQLDAVFDTAKSCGRP